MDFDISSVPIAEYVSLSLVLLSMALSLLLLSLDRVSLSSIHDKRQIVVQKNYKIY